MPGLQPTLCTVNKNLKHGKYQEMPPVEDLLIFDVFITHHNAYFNLLYCLKYCHSN